MGGSCLCAGKIDQSRSHTQSHLLAGTPLDLYNKPQAIIVLEIGKTQRIR